MAGSFAQMPKELQILLRERFGAAGRDAHRGVEHRRNSSKSLAKKLYGNLKDSVAQQEITLTVDETDAENMDFDSEKYQADDEKKKADGDDERWEELEGLVMPKSNLPKTLRIKRKMDKEQNSNSHNGDLIAETKGPQVQIAAAAVHSMREKVPTRLEGPGICASYLEKKITFASLVLSKNLLMQAIEPLYTDHKELGVCCDQILHKLCSVLEQSRSVAIDLVETVSQLEKDKNHYQQEAVSLANLVSRLCGDQNLKVKPDDIISENQSPMKSPASIARRESRRTERRESRRQGRSSLIVKSPVENDSNLQKKDSAEKINNSSNSNNDINRNDDDKVDNDNDADFLDEETAVEGTVQSSNFTNVNRPSILLESVLEDAESDESSQGSYDSGLEYLDSYEEESLTHLSESQQQVETSETDIGKDVAPCKDDDNDYDDDHYNNNIQMLPSIGKHTALIQKGPSVLERARALTIKSNKLIDNVNKTAEGAGEREAARLKANQEADKLDAELKIKMARNAFLERGQDGSVVQKGSVKRQSMVQKWKPGVGRKGEFGRTEIASIEESAEENKNHTNQEQVVRMARARGKFFSERAFEEHRDVHHQEQLTAKKLLEDQMRRLGAHLDSIKDGLLTPAERESKRIKEEEELAEMKVRVDQAKAENLAKFKMALRLRMYIRRWKKNREPRRVASCKIQGWIRFYLFWSRVRFRIRTKHCSHYLAGVIYRKYILRGRAMKSAALRLQRFFRGKRYSWMLGRVVHDIILAAHAKAAAFTRQQLLPCLEKLDELEKFISAVSPELAAAELSKRLKSNKAITHAAPIAYSKYDIGSKKVTELLSANVLEIDAVKGVDIPLWREIEKIWQRSDEMNQRLGNIKCHAETVIFAVRAAYRLAHMNDYSKANLSSDKNHKKGSNMSNKANSNSRSDHNSNMHYDDYSNSDVQNGSLQSSGLSPKIANNNTSWSNEPTGVYGMDQGNDGEDDSILAEGGMFYNKMLTYGGLGNRGILMAKISRLSRRACAYNSTTSDIDKINEENEKNVVLSIKAQNSLSDEVEFGNKKGDSTRTVFGRLKDVYTASLKSATNSSDPATATIVGNLLIPFTLLKKSDAATIALYVTRYPHSSSSSCKGEESGTLDQNEVLQLARGTIMCLSKASIKYGMYPESHNVHENVDFVIPVLGFRPSFERPISDNAFAVLIQLCQGSGIPSGGLGTIFGTGLNTSGNSTNKMTAQVPLERLAAFGAGVSSFDLCIAPANFHLRPPATSLADAIEETLKLNLNEKNKTEGQTEKNRKYENNDENLFPYSHLAVCGCIGLLGDSSNSKRFSLLSQDKPEVLSLPSLVVQALRMSMKMCGIKAKTNSAVLAMLQELNRPIVPPNGVAISVLGQVLSSDTSKVNLLQGNKDKAMHLNGSDASASLMFVSHILQMCFQVQNEDLDPNLQLKEGVVKHLSLSHALVVLQRCYGILPEKKHTASSILRRMARQQLRENRASSMRARHPDVDIDLSQTDSAAGLWLARGTEFHAAASSVLKLVGAAVRGRQDGVHLAEREKASQEQRRAIMASRAILRSRMNTPGTTPMPSAPSSRRPSILLNISRQGSTASLEQNTMQPNPKASTSDLTIVSSKSKDRDDSASVNENRSDTGSIIPKPPGKGRPSKDRDSGKVKGARSYVPSSSSKVLALEGDSNSILSRVKGDILMVANSSVKEVAAVETQPYHVRTLLGDQTEEESARIAPIDNSIDLTLIDGLVAALTGGRGDLEKAVHASRGKVKFSTPKEILSELHLGLEQRRALFLKAEDFEVRRNGVLLPSRKAPRKKNEGEKMQKNNRRGPKFLGSSRNINNNAVSATQIADSSDSESDCDSAGEELEFILEVNDADVYEGVQKRLFEMLKSRRKIEFGIDDDIIEMERVKEAKALHEEAKKKSKKKSKWMSSYHREEEIDTDKKLKETEEKKTMETKESRDANQEQNDIEEMITDQTEKQNTGKASDRQLTLFEARRQGRKSKIRWGDNELKLKRDESHKNDKDKNKQVQNSAKKKNKEKVVEDNANIGKKIGSLVTEEKTLGISGDEVPPNCPSLFNVVSKAVGSSIGADQNESGSKTKTKTTTTIPSQNELADGPSEDELLLEAIIDPIDFALAILPLHLQQRTRVLHMIWANHMWRMYDREGTGMMTRSSWLDFCSDLQATGRISLASLKSLKKGTNVSSLIDSTDKDKKVDGNEDEDEDDDDDDDDDENIEVDVRDLELLWLKAAEGKLPGQKTGEGFMNFQAFSAALEQLM